MGTPQNVTRQSATYRCCGHLRTAGLLYFKAKMGQMEHLQKAFSRMCCYKQVAKAPLLRVESFHEVAERPGLLSKGGGAVHPRRERLEFEYSLDPPSRKTSNLREQALASLRNLIVSPSLDDLEHSVFIYQQDLV